MGPGERGVPQRARGTYRYCDECCADAGWTKGQSREVMIRRSGVWDLVACCIKILEGAYELCEGCCADAGWTQGDLGGVGIIRSGYGIWRAGRASKYSMGIRMMLTSVALTPDGRKGISGSWDKTIRVWNLEQRDVHQCISHMEYCGECCADAGWMQGDLGKFGWYGLGMGSGERGMPQHAHGAYRMVWRVLR